MELSKEEIQIIRDAARDTRVSIYPDYSGRGMYGATCFGVVGALKECLQFVLGVAKQDIALADKLTRANRIDSMGLDTIVYFPDYSFDADAIKRIQEENEE